MTVKGVREILENLCDPEYQKFQSTLLPGTDNVLGVRVPELRKLARKMVQGNWRQYFDEAPAKYYEEDLLRGFLIGYAKLSLEERFDYIERFLPSIQNWAVCDGFCATLKFTKDHREKVWHFLEPLFGADEPFVIRFATVMALNYYLFPEYVPKVFNYLNQIQSDNYYVQMGIAWAVSIYYVHFPEMTEIYLKDNGLNDFTYNKSIQKICESYRVDRDTKARLKQMKR